MPKTSGGESAKSAKSSSAKPPASSDGQDAIPIGISLHRSPIPPILRGPVQPGSFEQLPLAQSDQTLTYTPTITKSQRKLLNKPDGDEPGLADLAASRAFTNALLTDASQLPAPPPVHPSSQLQADIGSALSQAPAYTASLSTPDKHQQSLELSRLLEAAKVKMAAMEKELQQQQHALATAQQRHDSELQKLQQTLYSQHTSDLRQQHLALEHKHSQAIRERDVEASSTLALLESFLQEQKTA